MAEDLDVALSVGATLLDRLPMRDENGEIRHEFVEAIASAMAAPIALANFGVISGFTSLALR